ncbi:MAG: hypothetical protein HW412_2548 [Bacteroidetes bacterium]|nr:hypothetical protein [Bacteroidota bacterium]
MKKSYAMLLAAMAVVGLLATGCNKDNGNGPDESAPTGVSNEQSARAYFATNDEFVKNDEQTIDDQDVQPTDYGTFGKVDANITPLRWGRFVRNVVRTVTRDTVLPGDTIAFVHIHKVITGVFRIRGINGNGDTVLVEKPFTDNADRNLIFRRVGRETKRFWLNSNNHIDITQLELITRNDTVVVTDPLQFYLRYRWLGRFNQGNRDMPAVDGGMPMLIKATVVSSSPDTDLVALRFGVGTFQKRRMRMNIVSEVYDPATQKYTRVFQAPFIMHFHRGFFHAAVDAATKATLFDDVAPYSVSWWGIPYRVF